MSISKEKSKFNRRNFIRRLVLYIVGIEFIYVILSMVGKKKLQNSNKQMFNAGKVSAFDNGNIYPFGSGRFYLSRFEDGGFLAISIKCTHLGCAIQPNKENSGFDCPCHASAFTKYGEVKSPPATRALDIFPVIIENGEVLVDINSPVKRKEFKKSQLTYA